MRKYLVFGLRIFTRPKVFWPIIFCVVIIGLHLPPPGSTPLHYFDYNGVVARLRSSEYARHSQAQAAPLAVSSPKVEHALTDTALLQALEYMDMLVKNDTIVDRLLAPLDDVLGVTPLQEVASRVRVYREAFTVWQDLHFAVSHGQPQARKDNITQRVQGLSTDDATEALETLTTFEDLIKVLGPHLFPWNIPAEKDYFADLHSSYSGRGIVLAIGDRMVADGIVLVESLRDLGCDLPVEVMYLGRFDLNEHNKALLEGIKGVTTKDLTSVVDDKAWKLEDTPWSAKPFAILSSSFREIIFIDADAYFFTNPNQLFGTKEYQTSGTVFFKDRTLFPRERREWLQKIIPHPLSKRMKKENRFWTGTSEHMQESGVVVVDKWRHFVPLLMSARLNGPDREKFREEVLGDKETFWLGFEMVGSEDYAFYPTATGSPGVLRVPDETKFDPQGREEHNVCSIHVLHFNATGSPMWFNGGLKENKVDDDAAWKTFTGYTREPVELDSPDQPELYDVEEANVLCLRSWDFQLFTKEEQKTLKSILAKAKEVDEKDVVL